MAVPSTAVKTTEGKTTGIAVPAPTITPAPVPGTLTAPKPNPYTVPAAGGVTQVSPTQPILIDGGATSAPAPAAPAAAATPTPAPTPTPAAAPAAGATPGVTPTLTPTNPANPLTSQTISPGPALDRFRLAREQFSTWRDATRPEYDADLRDAGRMAAATGGLGSGELRTRYGNLGLARDTQARTKEQELFQNAMLGTVDDARFSTGVAQQQQGFQNAQQQQAFENELRRMGFSEDVINSQFGRALQTYMAGQSGGTGSWSGLQGANTAGQEGGDALSALFQYLQNRARTTGTAPAATPSTPLPTGQTVLRPPTVSG
jgi:hypothetical protein